MKLRKASFWTKILVPLTALCCIAALVSQQAQLRQGEAQLDALQDQAAQLSQENTVLEAVIAAADTEEGILEIARTELGLLQPGEIIFVNSEH